MSPLLLHVHLLHSCQQASQQYQHDHPVLQNVLVESHANSRIKTTFAQLRPQAVIVIT